MADIKGFKELSKQLSKLGSAAGGRALRNSAKASMRPALRAAKANVPVGSLDYNGKNPYPQLTYKGNEKNRGHAKRSIKLTSYLSRDKRRAGASVGVEAEAFYALQFVELGTAYIAKNPWLTPAFRSSVPAIDALLKVKIKEQLDKAVK